MSGLISSTKKFALFSELQKLQQCKLRILILLRLEIEELQQDHQEQFEAEARVGLLISDSLLTTWEYLTMTLPFRPTICFVGQVLLPRQSTLSTSTLRLKTDRQREVRMIFYQLISQPLLASYTLLSCSYDNFDQRSHQ